MTIQLRSITIAELIVHGCYPESSLHPFGPEVLATVHSDWVTTGFGRKRCLSFVKVIIMSLLGAVIVVLGDYFTRVVYPLHPPWRSVC